MNSFLSQLEERTRALRASATPKLASAASALQAGAKTAGALLAETATTLAEQAARAAATGGGGGGGAGGGSSAQHQQQELTVVAGSGGGVGGGQQQQQHQASPRAPTAATGATPLADTANDDDGNDELRHRLFARPDPAAAAVAADEGARAHCVRMVLLAAGPVDLAALRRAARQPGGLPARDGLRAAAWRLLLGYLPASCPVDEWGTELARRRAEYRRFCDDLIVDPTAAAAAADDEEGAVAEEEQEQERGSSPPAACAAAPDHPLSTQPASKWAEFFRDGDVLAQIRRDVARTHPESSFLGETGGAAAARRRSEVARGLFVFAKLNPGVRYVQGMNELFAVLYWVFATDPAAAAEEAARTTAAATATTTAGAAAPPPPPPRPVASDAEADAFWGFVALVSGPARDLFCASLDNDGAVGVRAVCGRLARALRARDPPLAAHLLDDLAVDPRFFAFRWVTLMLAREFELDAVLEIWDAALACGAGGGESGEGVGGSAGEQGDQGEARLEFFLRVSLSMLAAVRGRLLEADFGGAVKLLQHYPPEIGVRALLAAAQQAAFVPP